MLIKLPAGFVYGAKPTSRVPPQIEMSLAVRGVFRLWPGEPVALITALGAAEPLQGDTFAAKDEERTGALLHAGDFADFKMRADVLLAGTCRPSGGRSARDCLVTLRVGTWSKSVRVFGRRVWTAVPGDPISIPAPFVSMPLSWENAFGGNDFAANPVGRGIADGELPNVEDPRALLRSRRDRPAPAGFGPINPAWPPRAGKLGKEYGASWKKTRAPWYSTDFDWSHFNAAPLDQQVPYPRGDEEIELQHLFDDTQTFVARLPGLRLRAFARQTSGETREVPMNLDTLLVDADRGQLHLTWRGLTPVKDDDLADVRTVLVATEPLADRPASVKEYGAAIDAFEATGVDPAAHVPPELLARKAEAEALMQSMPAPKAPDAGAHPVDMAAQAAAAAMGGLDPEKRAQAEEAFDRMKASYDAAAARFPSVAAKAGPQQAVTDPFAASLEQLARARASAVSRGLPTDKLDAASAQVTKAKEEHAAAEARTQAAAKAAPPNAPAVHTPTLGETMAGAAAAARGQRPDSVAAPPPAEPGPRADLMGRDLSGQDLRGRNLEGALLRRAKLRGAVLAGANLRRADLGEADLEGADLEGADLSNANLTKANLRGAKLDRARLSQTLLSGAQLAAATLNEVAGSMVVFQKANLEGCVLRQARLHKCLAHGACLDGADFTLSDLGGSVFMEASAKKAVFAACKLDKVAFLRCDLTEASFVQARGKETSFQGSTLEGAFLHYVRLPGAHFTEAILRRAHIYGAYLVRARLYRAVLEDAEIVRSDLRSVDARKAVVGRTKFTGTNLYDAKLFGVVGTAECDFFEANLAAAMWELP